MTNDCKTCPVSTGTHQPAEALHQISEPAASVEKEIQEVMILVNTVQKNRVCAEMSPSNKDHFNEIAQAAATEIVGKLRALLSTPQPCSRSHPHEEMTPMCELRTEIARLTNALARAEAAAQQGVQPKGEWTREVVQGSVVIRHPYGDSYEFPISTLAGYFAHPTQQGMDAFRALYDSVVHSIDEGLLTGKALEAIILVPAVDFFESAKQTYTKEPQSELELNSARWKHVTNEAGTGIVSLVRFALNGSPCVLIGSEADSFVDAAIAAQAKQGEQP